MNTVIKKIVVLGGGTAGWLSAALLKKIIGGPIEIELVESPNSRTECVVDGTIPPIRLINNVLGINEAEFLRETKATMCLAIKFENWRVPGESYFHTFGAPGKSTAFCQFHHFWTRARQMGEQSQLWEYDLNYLCATQGKFAHINSKDPILELPYAYHFDTTLYAAFLRKYCEKIGVTRTQGIVESTIQNPHSGYIEKLVLQSKQHVTGDLFIDCSGPKGELIQQVLGTGYDDWSHLLPCDRVTSVLSERFDVTLPYTRAIAHRAGWQWRIPLQHLNGNGLVYSGAHCSDDEALDTLMNNLDSPAIGEPKITHFRTGRRRLQWHKNVVSVGLSSGFLEPLESTTIHLIQSAIIRLIHLFPHNGIDQASVDEYNHQSEVEYTQIRDFLILHYHLNQRQDTQFWRNMQNIEIPDPLKHKVKLFAQTGKLCKGPSDLFLESSWLQVMLGQGIMPKDYHPIADHMSPENLTQMLDSIAKIKQGPVSSLPSHDEFLTHYIRTA